MSTKGGKYKGYSFHGDPKRFEVVADFVFERFGRTINYIADVAGGQGMLTRLLTKKSNYEVTLIDPRGYALLGVPKLVQLFNTVL